MRHAQDGTGNLNGVFAEDTPDHRILSVAAELSGGNVVLISKDINLRMKAMAVGIAAEDYITDKIDCPDKLYTGSRLVEGVSADSISALYEQPYSVEPADVPLDVDPVPNQFFIIRNGAAVLLPATLHTTATCTGSGNGGPSELTPGMPNRPLPFMLCWTLR